MCGFVGFINCGSRLELEKAAEIIKHRGPDDGDVKWLII